MSTRPEAREASEVDRQELARAKLKLLLAQRKLTQKTFAELVGVHPVTVNRWVTGGTGLNYNSLEQICSALNLSIEWFLTDNIQPDMIDAITELHGLTNGEQEEVALRLNGYLAIGLSEKERGILDNIIALVVPLSPRERIRVANAVMLAMGDTPTKDKLRDSVLQARNQLEELSRRTAAVLDNLTEQLGGPE